MSLFSRTFRASILISWSVALFPAVGITGTNSSSCTSIDYRSELPPARSQGDIGWCYANAAADLLGWRFRKEMNNQPVSAVYTALKYTDMFAPSNYSEGGYIRLALNRSLKQGMCPQSLEDQAMHQGYHLDVKEKIEVLKKIKSLFDGGKTSELNNLLDELAKNGSIVSKIERRQLFELLGRSDKRNFPSHFADLFCGSQRFKPAYRPVIGTILLPPHLNSPLFVMVDKQLERHNIVGFNFMGGFLTELNAPWRMRDGHAAVFVGRRWNPEHQTCEYLVRNSWGKGGGVFASNIGDEHDGNIWISRELLARYLYGITFFAN